MFQRTITAIAILLATGYFATLVAQEVVSDEIMDLGPNSEFVRGPVILSDDEMAAIESGSPIIRVQRDAEDKEATVQVVSAVKINASTDIVWQIMYGCDASKKVVRNLKSCTILEQSEDGSYDIREHIVKYSFLFPSLRNVFRSEYSEPNEIYFYRVGGDLKFQEGIWRLEEVDEGNSTLVYYKARLALKVPAPRFLIRRSIRKDIPEIFHQLRELAEAESLEET